MNGFILTSKSLPESPIWDKPPLYLKVWMYLLLNACYTDVGNLKRGQIMTSIPEIQEACAYHVGYRKVTPTYKEVRDVIDYLRKPYEGQNGGQTKGNMIVTTKVTHGFIATICNYEVYQDFKTYEGQDEGNTADARRATQGHNKKKEYKRNNKYIDIYSGLPDELVTALKDFEEMRKLKKSPMTDRAKELLLSNLTKLAGDDTQLKVKILNQSIANTWTNVYELKENANDDRGSNKERKGVRGSAGTGDRSVGTGKVPSWYKPLTSATALDEDAGSKDDA